MSYIKHRDIPNVSIGIEKFPDKKRYNLIFKNEKGYWPVATFKNDEDAMAFLLFLETLLVENEKNLAFEMLKNYPDNIKDKNDAQR